MSDISVIIPVYNTEKYIVECIESILANQNINYEVICVNDGSTDSSLELINNLAKNNACITVISQENKGQSAARNQALKVAKGKYVYFLDSDDMISTDALFHMYEYMERDCLDVLYFSGDSFYDPPKLESEFSSFSKAYLRKGTYDGWHTGLTLLPLLMKQSDYSVSPCIQIIRKDFLTKNNIDFQEGIIHEDNLFSFKVIFFAQRAKCVNDIYFHRRVRADSVMTTTRTYKNLLGYYICFLNILSFIFNKDIPQEAESVINGILRSLKLNVHRSYFAIDDGERKLFYQHLTSGEKMFFLSIILHELETDVAYKKEITMLQHPALVSRIRRFVVQPVRRVCNLIKRVGRNLYGKIIHNNAGI